MYELDAKPCRRWVSGNGHCSARLGIKLILSLYSCLYLCYSIDWLCFFFSLHFVHIHLALISQVGSDKHQPHTFPTSVSTG